MGLLVGMLIIGISIIGGFSAMGGHFSVLWQPYEALIVVGAALGSYVVANPRYVLLDTLKAIRELFSGARYKEADYLQLLGLQFTLFRMIRARGLMQMEKHIERPFDSDLFQQFPSLLRNRRPLQFICDYMRLISLGSAKPHEVEALMDEEIRTVSKELHRSCKALHSMADGLPALGIIAAVLGVIKAMGAIDQPPAVLGGLIGGALVGTFLGVFLSYGVVGPIAAMVRANRDAEINFFVSIKAGLLAHLNGASPQVCVEYARKVLYSEIQPSFQEVEEITTLATIKNKSEARQERVA